MERPEQEDFGEASPGEAQSENPPADPEMLRDEAEEAEGGGSGESSDEPPEEAAEDQDAGPSTTPEEVERDPQRDQAEG